jgi:hypothetical protein
LKSLATGAFDPGRGCIGPPGFNPNGSLRANAKWKSPGFKLNGSLLANAKWMSLNFLKPEGLAYPLPVVVTTG